jgi:uncharacterized protein (TIGR00251 family)
VRLKNTKDGVILSVYVHPSAKQDRIDTTEGIEIYTREPPKENKANYAIVKLLSKALGIPRQDISIIRGATSRAKEIHIHGINTDKLKRLMQGSNNE